jgi:DNA-binding transcriptional LysR family regulator
LAYRFGGKQKLLAFGAYPLISLAEARQKRDAAKRLLASGIDPAQQAKLDKIHRRTSSANTFNSVADEFLLKVEREGRAAATLAGESFVTGCQRVMETLEGAISQAKKIADGEAGNLVIGYTDTAMSGELSEIIKSFRSANPQIHIHLRQAYTLEQIRMLEDGQIDIGFLTGPTKVDHFHGIDVQRDRFVAIFPRDHELASRSKISLADLATYPFVLGDLVNWSVYHEQLFSLCDRAGFRPNIVQTAPDSRGIIGLVSCGMGVSVQTECLTKAGDDRVVFKFLSDCEEYLTTQAAWNVKFDHPCKIRFIRHIENYQI